MLWSAPQARIATGNNSRTIVYQSSPRHPLKTAILILLGASAFAQQPPATQTPSTPESGYTRVLLRPTHHSCFET